MNRTISLLVALMAAPLAETLAEPPKRSPDGAWAVASRVDEFVNEPLFVRNDVLMTYEPLDDYTFEAIEVGMLRF